MLQLEINGKEVSVPEGSSVMDAAHKAGTFIPYFCYHKKLSIVASCRMCLVEVEKAPKPQPACATPASNGMKVHTNSKLAKDAQKGVMEFLLMNHPLDCPICDQGGECRLQDLSVGYGAGSGRFTEPKRVVKAKDMGSLISTEEMSRCIHCTRCIRFTEEIAGYQEIGMVNRGDHSEIIPFIGKVVTSEISGNVIDLCPVGALTSKPFRYSARSWELSRRKSISAHDALGSNLIIQVKDHKVKRVLPLENEEINECWLSDKDRFAYEGLNSEERLARPMIKQNNEWHEVEWHTALEYVIKGLNGVSNDHGKDSIFCFVNSTSTFEETYLAHKLAKQFGIKNITSGLRTQGTLDSFGGAYWLGQSVQEFLTNDMVFVIGSTLRSEQPLLTARIRGAVNKNNMQLHVLNAVKEELHITTASQTALNPVNWCHYLQEFLNTITALKSGQDIVASDLKTLAQALIQSEKGSLVLGALAQNHPDFSKIASLSAQITQESNVTLGFLPQSANQVGAQSVELMFKDKLTTAKEILAHGPKACVLVHTEPQNDFYNNAQALEQIKEAETVIAMSPFKDATLLEYADVILPISPYTETAGSFVNMEGRAQSFYGTVQPYSETRPLWKVLRVLANMLNLSGFEFNTIEEVREEAFKFVDLEKQISNKLNSLSEKIEESEDAILYRVGDIGLYETDAIVRRAIALQQTPQAQTPKAFLSPETLNQLGFQVGERVTAQQENGSPISVEIAENSSLAKNVVSLIHHTDTNTLGSLLGEIKLSRG